MKLKLTLLTLALITFVGCSTTHIVTPQPNSPEIIDIEVVTF